MNWKYLRTLPWLDTRSKFVASTPRAGNLLDLGSSNGETLGHFAELRPDLNFFAADIQGMPENYPAGCKFHRGDLQKDRLPWPDASLDAATCMHLIEHMHEHRLLLSEIYRLLKPGARVYFETPHPRSLVLSSPKGRAAGTFTMNFYDDPTHLKPIAMGTLAIWVRQAGFEIEASGISRNLLFAASYPVFLLLPASRQKFTSRAHWLGWSAYMIARRPA